MTGRIVAVHRRAAFHAFSKDAVAAIELVAGHGVRDDAHFGVTVQHLSRVAKDPENITTRGIDLLAVSAGSLLRIGATAVVRVTGLRNPCGQIDAFQPGLLQAVLDHAADGTLVRRTGIMGVVEEGGWVRAGDALGVGAPAIHTPLQVV